MLTRDESLTLCDAVLAHAKSAGAEDATVSVQSTVESHARFADNRITTSGRADDLDITATVWVGRRRGAATGNDPGAAALQLLADEAVQIARVSPVHREYVPTLGPLDYPAERGFAAATADVDLAARAAALEAVLAACRTAEGHRRRLSQRPGLGHRRGHRQRQPALLPQQRGRLQRHRPQRRWHRLGLLRRRPFRPGAPRRSGHRRARRWTRRCARAGRSRSSRASTR